MPKRRSRQIMDAASIVAGHYNITPCNTYTEIAEISANLKFDKKPESKREAENYLLDLAEAITKRRA